ncbi:MAG: hypothetical protein LAT52_12160 [Balneolales bacterium]|nr:hypothetical protein [Balneolales bacterium]
MPAPLQYSKGFSKWRLPLLPLLLIAVPFVMHLTGCRSVDAPPRSLQLSGEVLSALPADTLYFTHVAGNFSRISDLFVAASGTMYVADAGRHHIIRLNATGERLDSLGGRGVGNVQFDNPTHIDAGNELKIYVSDVGNQRISMFDRRWQPLGFLDLTPGRYEPGALVQTPQGEVIFWDQEGQRLRKVRADAQPDQFYQPDVSEVEHAPVALLQLESTLWLVDGTAGVVHRFGMNGRRLGFIHVGAEMSDGAVNKGEVLLLTPQGLLRMRASGEIIHLYVFGSDKTYTRISVHENILYLATPTDLYKTTLP